MELLENPQYCYELSMQELEVLLLRAGYDREKAHKVALDHGNNRLSAGKTA